MTVRHRAFRNSATAAGALFGALAVATSSVHALTLQECSVKYSAARSAGTLNGMKWSEFRKAQCGADAAAAAPTTPTPLSGRDAMAKQTPAAGSAVFPSAVSPKYSTESAGKARMHTCLDQYNQNKASNANGGMNWIQKGGGYYSECNRRLKG